MITVYLTHNRASDAFLRDVLTRYHQIERPTVLKTQYGKPYLHDHALHFNLSHTSDMVALAVCNEQVGLDLQLRTDRDYCAIKSRLTEAEKGQDFFELWTVKEAYCKYLGKTLASLLPHLEYRDGALYENEKKADVFLHRFTWGNAAGCICTASKDEVQFIALD